MNETTNILAFRQPGTVDDPLTDILCGGTLQMLDLRTVAPEWFGLRLTHKFSTRPAPIWTGS